MQLVTSNPIQPNSSLASFLQPVNLQIHKDAWALLHLVLQDQRKRDHSQKAFARRSSLRSFADLLFMQAIPNDKNAFDLYDALGAVQWDHPFVVPPEFLTCRHAWRENHAYDAADTPAVSFDSLSRLKQFETKMEG